MSNDLLAYQRYSRDRANWIRAFPPQPGTSRQIENHAPVINISRSPRSFFSHFFTVFFTLSFITSDLLRSLRYPRGATRRDATRRWTGQSRLFARSTDRNEILNCPWYSIFCVVSPFKKSYIFKGIRVFFRLLFRFRILDASTLYSQPFRERLTKVILGRICWKLGKENVSAFLRNLSSVDRSSLPIVTRVSFQFYFSIRDVIRLGG